MREKTHVQVEDLGRTSRRVATLTLLAVLVVLGSLGYAAWQLGDLQAEVANLRTERGVLVEQRDQLSADIDDLRGELTGAREAVQATRVAINAFHARQYDQAVEIYDQALAVDPNNAYVLNLRAYALFRLNRVEEAIASQESSLAVDPNYAWGYFDLGRFLCAADPPQWEAARQAIDRALELRPGLREVMAGDGEFQSLCARILATGVAG